MFDVLPRARMNCDLSKMEKHTYFTRGERAALKRAKRAEKEFRKSKGYKPDNLLYRIYCKLKALIPLP